MDDEKNRLRMIAISGASHAVDYMKANPKALPSEVIKHVTDNSDEIINKVDSGDEI